MKKVTLAIAMAALVIFAGCKKDKETTGTTLKASIEQYKSGDSKTSIDPSNGAIKWTTGDKIVVNNGTTSGTFTLTSGQGSTTGTFTFNGEYTLGENNIAVYPETATISGSTVTVTLPAEQTYAAERNGSTPMLGTFTNPDDLTFTSLCGALGISLKAASADVAITAIEVVSKTDEKLNGTFTVDATATGDDLKLVKSGSDGTNSVRFNCNATLTNAEAQNFYFAMPVGALANGFILNVYGDGADPIFSTDTDNNITIVLNQVNQMPEVSVALAPPFDPLLTTPLTLEALSDGNIQVNISSTLSTGMKYSVNNGAKTTIYETTDIVVNAGDKVQFYGNDTITQVYGYNPTVKLQGSAQTKVYGNIMSLIDEGNYATCTTLSDKTYVFNGLFRGNVNLTDASGLLLPATTLAPYCYASMFRGCSSLQTAPELLPAPELAPNCYYYMFYDCTSLTTVPALPATMLAEKCYYYMFRDCTSLQTVPSDLLPATTLANECYSNMFNSCWSLTTAPTLPATTLAPNCYASMFRGCSSLQTAPELLPAPELAPNCYYYMFYGCTSLTTVPALPATMLANSCYAYMFQDCKGLQTVPSDLLSTTTLAYSCYSCMFYGCSSLTTAPTLPATTLADECYYRMFENCSQLNSITCLATSFGSNSTMYWVSGVASSGTFTKAAGASWPTGNHGIPSGWTVVTPVPEGAINGLFTVNDNGTKVYFSKGSLQYIGSASTPYWKFADNQWDLLSTTNQNTNNTNVDRDIFCWGTSGYAHGATFYQPWEHGSNNNQFYAYGDIANYLSASTGKADWGYNAISNGGNQEHLWYTLDKDEWTYLLINRPGSTVNGTDNARYARATVEGINGVILFPDIYTHPADVNQPNYINSNSGGWANTYTAADFMKMEAHGAVFLPAGGGYVGGNIVNRNAAVFYWSSQPDNGNALGLYLNNNSINCANSMYRHLGLGVRLVKDVQ